MFDSLCKFLAETFSDDFATWLLGEAISLTELSPTELSLEPIRADALILLQSEELVLHLEFQTQPKADVPFRMADYRLRVHRRFPNKRMRQIVIYLQPTSNELAQQTTFLLESTRHEFEVIRLWEQPVEVLMQSPGLFPLAALAQTPDPNSTLERVALKIDRMSDRRVQSNLVAAAAVLAGLILEEEAIARILRRDVMQESTIYQSIKAEGRSEGRSEGRAEERQEVALNLLEEGMTVEAIARVTGLSVEQVRQLQSATPDESQN
jgi:predicted transposase/invertase (TIGR01784 family)